MRVPRSRTLQGDNDDQDAGIKIVLRALEEPLRQIASNAGMRSLRWWSTACDRRQGRVRLQRRHRTSTAIWSQMGVIDPTKVTRIALQNAASVAGLILTTDCMMAEIAQPKPAPGMGDMEM